MEILLWIPLLVLATHNFLRCSYLHIFFFSWTTPFPTQALISFPSFPSPSFFFHQKQDTLLFPWYTPWTLLKLALLVQWKFGIPSLQSMAPSSFMNQWESKMIFSPMEIRMRILMPNETRGRFHFLIKIRW